MRTTATASYEAQRLEAMRTFGPNAKCEHGMPLYEGCYTCLVANSVQVPASPGNINRMMREVSTWIAQLPAPVKFERGQLVAVADQPFEVVMHKDGTVYVKDENGKVTGHPAAWVAAL